MAMRRTRSTRQDTPRDYSLLPEDNRENSCCIIFDPTELFLILTSSTRPDTRDRENCGKKHESCLHKCLIRSLCIKDFFYKIMLAAGKVWKKCEKSGGRL